MPGNVSDEAFARYVNQIGNATLDQIEAARTVQAENARKGIVISLGEVLVQQGILTQAIRENIEKKLQAQQQGGIQKFGQFKLLKKLGEGGMGAVYLAEDTNAGRQVAIKLLPKKHAGDSEFLSRFHREARAAGQLNHVNIVGAHTVGEEMGYHYIVMEYVEGEPLDKILKRDHALPWDKALEIVMEVARGLKHAHEHGIIHRDIKPGNIILTPKGVAKILDLGLSKTIGSDEQTFHTQTGVALGTPHYLSPEQARGDKSIDGRTDIYSLGATFYHLVTGQTPFQGSTAAVIMLKHLNEQLVNPQDIVEDLPDGVAHVIMKMMAKAPIDRYRDCKELLDDLELIIDGKMPSSHAIEVGKSSVAVARVVRSRDRKGAVPLAHARGSESPRALRHHVPVDQRGTGQQAADQAEAPPSSKKNLYIAAGFGALAVLAVVIALVASRSREQQAAVHAVEEKRKAEDDKTGRLAEQKRKAEEARLKSEAARLEEERRKLADDKRKAEEALVAAEAEAKKKAGAAKSEIPNPKSEGNTKVETATTEPGAGETPAVRTAADSRAEKAQQLLSAVLKETAPLLAQNKFADAIALLDRKAKDPALSDAAELLKQERADVESVVELRKAAIAALRKMAGKVVSLKVGGTAVTGKLKDDALGKGVILDKDGAQFPVISEKLSADDVDQYAPRTENVGADLRQRGIMYLAAGNVARAKECFTKPAVGRPSGSPRDPEDRATTYLDRITAIEMGDIEAAALKAWEKAEKLFAAKDMKGAKAAYEAFERDHGQTAAAKTRAATVRERYDAIEKVLGPAPTLTLDLGGGVKMEMVLIPAGKFIMGSPDNEPGREGDGREGPQHEVTITKPFYMGRYEVTVAQFRRFAETAKYRTECERGGNRGLGWDNGWAVLTGVNWMKPNFPQDDNHPVCLISWNDAQAFVSWAAKATGKRARLPTEAEWEYACRAKTTTRFYAGQEDKELDKAGWFDANSERRTHPVGQKAPNVWGLYDMHGNVCDWCEDRYQKDYYKDSTRADPPGPTVGNDRVLRGGSWFDPPGQCRSAFRLWSSGQGHWATSLGFRVVVGCGASETPGRAALPEAPVPTPAIPANLPKDLALNLGGGARMDFVLVPAGEFMMGADDGEACEKPVHKVKISQPFYIGKYDVTVAQFRVFADAMKFQTEAEKRGKGFTSKDGGWSEVAGVNWRTPGFPQEDNYPACVITWNDAQAFCKWAAKTTGRNVSLPTEAQWEYACRAGTTTRYNTGDKDSDLEQAAWFNKNSGMHTNAVGQKKPNTWGLYDMHGNVWEWVQDYFNDKYYGESPPVDPKGPTSGGDRVLRGGGWGDNPDNCRAAHRDRLNPGFRHTYDGFRCAVDF